MSEDTSVSEDDWADFDIARSNYEMRLRRKRHAAKLYARVRAGKRVDALLRDEADRLASEIQEFLQGEGLSADC